MTAVSRTKKSTISFVFGLFEKALVILLPFLVRSFLIYKMGAEYVGINGLFSSILTFLNIVDLGFGSAVMFCLYKPVADDDIQKINALSRFLRKTYIIISISIFILGCFILPFLPYFVNGDYPPDINIYIIFMIYILNSSSSYLFSSYKVPVLEAYHRNYSLSLIRSIVEIFKSVAQIIILILFSNYYLFALILPIATIILYNAFGFYAKKTMPAIKPIGTIDCETKKLLKSKMFFLGLNKVSSVLINSVDNIVISSFLGLVAVGLYGNYALISSALIGIVIVLYSALKPAIANQMVKDGMSNSVETFKNIYLISIWICSWMAITFFVLSQTFIRIWIGEAFLLSTLCVLLIVIFFFLNALRHFFAHLYIDICGLWNKTVVVQIAVSILNLCLDIILIRLVGIEGVVLASVVCISLLSLPYDIYIVANIFKEQRATILKSVFKLFFFFACSTLLSYVLIQKIYSLVNVNVFPSFILLALLCLIVPNILYSLIFIIENNSLKYISNHLRTLLKRK